MTPHLHLIHSEPPIDRHLDAIMDGILRRERMRKGRRYARLLIVLVWTTVLALYVAWGPK